MTTAATNGSTVGRALAERLGLPILGREGHDLKMACVACPSSDAARIHAETGVYSCHRCQAKHSPFTLAESIVGRIQAKVLMVELNIFEPSHNGNGEHATPDPMALIARQKGVTVAALEAFGAVASGPDKITLPAYGPDGEQCTTFTLFTSGSKGRFEHGKPAGLFLPHIDGAVRRPKPGEVWHAVEGPKDAAAGHDLGLLMLGLNTCQMAAKFARLFQGVEVVVIPDRDGAGVDGASHTARVLYGVATSIKIVTLPAEFKDTHGADLRDVLEEKNGRELVMQAIADAAPWQPAGAESKSDRLTNAVEVESTGADGKDKITLAPLPMPEVKALLYRQTDGWPRRVGTSLFVPDADGVHWLKTPAALFGWVAERSANPVWHKVRGVVTKEEFYEELRRTSQKYKAVEAMPHVPSVDGHYYSMATPAAGDGSALTWLLGRLAYETPIDRDLAEAAFATIFWGGLAGARPAFVTTADAGRGKGKSTLAKLIGRLAGGLFDFDARDDIAAIKKRLLTVSEANKRVCLLDNVKSHRFSWAALEAIITAPEISGHRMFHGEGTRPNLLTWHITLNGASLSTDMAQRSVIVKLGEPKYDGDWESDTFGYIDDNGERIIADVVAFFARPRATLAKFTRWGTWERDVLSRLADPEEAQRVILERQGEVDVDAEEIDIIEGYFADRLADLGYDVQSVKVLIPSPILCDWFCAATNEKDSASATARALKQMHNEKRLRCLAPNKCLTYGRGFLWWGLNASVVDAIRTDLSDRISTAKRR